MTGILKVFLKFGGTDSFCVCLFVCLFFQYGALETAIQGSELIENVASLYKLLKHQRHSMIKIEDMINCFYNTSAFSVVHSPEHFKTSLSMAAPCLRGSLGSNERHGLSHAWFCLSGASHVQSEFGVSTSLQAPVGGSLDFQTERQTQKHEGRGPKSQD